MLFKENENRKPRLHVSPQKQAYTDGEDAAELFAAYSFELDDWQKDLLNAWLARDEHDTPLYLTCGLSAPRQNGKNVVLEAYELYKLVACKEPILHTAHLVSSAKKSFERLAAVFTNRENEDLCALVKNIRRTNGEQGIYLNNGAFIEYSSRSRGGARGSTYAVVVFDEAQELTDEQVEAIMPTLAASPTGYRQLVYTGTPPGPTCPGTIFANIRKSSLSTPAPKTICWHEWSIEKLLPQNTEFQEIVPLVYSTNPAMGIRLDVDFAENEFNTMTIDGFCRERLGWWEEKAQASAIISKQTWQETEIEEIADKYKSRTAIAIKFSADGSQYVIAGCKTNYKGEAAFEIIEAGTTENGVYALAEAIMARKGVVCVCVIDGLSNASALCDNLAALKAPKGYILRPTGNDIVAASQGLIDALVDKRVKHTSQDLLNDSALTSSKRNIGNRGGWGFGGDNSSPIEAVALAYWGIRNTKRNPKRKQRLL